MRLALCAIAAAVLSACDHDGVLDGTRGPCAAGGQVLGDCPVVETAEDACWKLVQCAVLPVDDEQDPYRRDWGTCVDRIEEMRALDAEVAIACVDAASCDQLATGDEWPDCLEYP